MAIACTFTRLTPANITAPSATFWSGKSSIARNALGTMDGYVVSQNADYTDQTLRIYWRPLGGARVLVHEASGHINPPAFASAESGEFWAAWCDWDEDKVYLAIWPNMTGGTVPTVKEIDLPPIDGKWNLDWDEARRILRFMNNGSGKLLLLDADGELIRDPLQLFEETGGVAVNSHSQVIYPMFLKSPQGHFGITGSTFAVDDPPGAATRYDSIFGGVSPDLVNFAPLTRPWADPHWVSKVKLPTPIGEGPLLLSRPEELEWNNLISAALLDERHLHVIYSVNPKTDDPQFSTARGRNAAMAYRRYSARTGALDFAVPLTTVDGFSPWAPGSHLVWRNGRLCHIGYHDTDLFVMSTSGDPYGWRLDKRFSVPGPSVRFPHYVSCHRGQPGDTDVLGLITVVNCSRDAWIAGTGYPQPANVYQFRITF